MCDSALVWWGEMMDTWWKLMDTCLVQQVLHFTGALDGTPRHSITEPDSCHWAVLHLSSKFLTFCQITRSHSHLSIFVLQRCHRQLTCGGRNPYAWHLHQGLMYVSLVSSFFVSSWNYVVTCCCVTVKDHKQVFCHDFCASMAAHPPWTLCGCLHLTNAWWDSCILWLL